MPYKDPSFTSGDIIRIWCNNLNDKEQLEVFLFFITVYPGLILTNEQLSDIFEIIDEFTSNTLFSLAVKGITAYMKILRMFLHKTCINLIFDSPAKEDIIKCVTKFLNK